jgi:hypothetical protein
MKVLLVMTLMVGGALTACGDPCQELANKVCSCSPNDAARRACLSKVSSLASQRHANADKAEEQAGRHLCASLLSQCTPLDENKNPSCEPLRNGGWRACGLSTE